MDMSSSLGRAELLRVAETVAQEKGISPGEVLDAMEQALAEFSAGEVLQPC